MLVARKKSARKDEKTLLWPPSIIARLVTKLNGKQNSAEITNNQTFDDIYIVKQKKIKANKSSPSKIALYGACKAAHNGFDNRSNVFFWHRKQDALFKLNFKVLVY